MNWTKEEVFALMDEKKRIEKEMAEWTEVLNNEGGVGLHEPLVDEEGNLNIYMSLDNAIVLKHSICKCFFLIIRIFLFKVIQEMTLTCIRLEKAGIR